MSAYARNSELLGILCIFIWSSNSIHRSTQTCIEHSLAVFAAINLMIITIITIIIIIIIIDLFH